MRTSEGQYGDLKAALVDMAMKYDAAETEIARLEAMLGQLRALLLYHQKDPEIADKFILRPLGALRLRCVTAAGARRSPCSTTPPGVLAGRSCSLGRMCKGRWRSPSRCLSRAGGGPRRHVNGSRARHADKACAAKTAPLSPLDR